MTNRPIPNRRNLSQSEIEAVDEAVSRYRESKNRLHAEYLESLARLVDARDEVILAVMRQGARSTQARLAEYLGMSSRSLRNMRDRLEARRVSQTA